MGKLRQSTEKIQEILDQADGIREALEQMPGSADWEAAPNEKGYIKNKPFGEIYNQLEWYYSDDEDAVVSDTFVDKVFIDGKEYNLTTDEILGIDNTHLAIAISDYSGKVKVYGGREKDVDWVTNNVLAYVEKTIDEHYIPNTIARTEKVQPKLVSGENIKTVNGESILGKGDLKISGGGGADWNAKDGEEGFIKNKPFYDEINQKFDANKFSYNEDREEFYLDLYSLAGDDIYIKYKTSKDSSNYKVKSFQVEYGYNFNLFYYADFDVSCWIEENDEGHAVLVLDMLAESDRHILQALLNEFLSYCLRWQDDDSEVVKTIDEYYIPHIFPRRDEVDKKQDKLVSGENIKKINGNSILGSGNLSINVTTYTPIAYSNLVNLRNYKKLVAGTFYRITDYITTTTQYETQSAGHPFDVIVLALSESTLAEEAYAIQSARDTGGYFAKSNLAAWKLWYCLDNDTNRFAWADSTNGKGVIYRMIDEWQNDIPYDFKNIQFLRTINFDNGHPRYMEDGDEMWVYTFCGASYHIDNDEWSNLEDGSLEPPFNHQSDEDFSTFHHNSMKPWIKYFDEENEDYNVCGKAYLNKNVFLGYWEKIGSTNGNYPFYYPRCCFSNTLGDNCYNNTFGAGCYCNIMRNMCYGNTLCEDCRSNEFENMCYYNTFGKGCDFNKIGGGSNYIVFGNACISNEIIGSSTHIAFGNMCTMNLLSGRNSDITLGENCNYNSFGLNCREIVFMDQNDIAKNVRYNKFDDGVYSVQCYLDEEHDKYRFNYIQNLHICKGAKDRTIEVFLDSKGEITYALNSDGNVVEFVLGDLKAS